MGDAQKTTYSCCGSISAVATADSHQSERFYRGAALLGEGGPCLTGGSVNTFERYYPLRQIPGAGECQKFDIMVREFERHLLTQRHHASREAEYTGLRDCFAA